MVSAMPRYTFTATFAHGAVVCARDLVAQTFREAVAQVRELLRRPEAMTTLEVEVEGEGETLHCHVEDLPS